MNIETTNQFLASVVVVGFNGKQHIGNCLSSLLEQTVDAEKYEVVYVDNFSSDGSLKFVKEEFPTVNIIALKTNYGYGGAVNRAIRDLKGDVIVVLNQDTVVVYNWLEKICEALHCENRKIDVAIANQLLPDSVLTKDEVIDTTHVHAYHLTQFGYAKLVKYIKSWQPVQTRFLSGAAFGFRRSLLESINYLFDEDFFMYSEDIELSLRLMLLDMVVAVIPEAQLIHFPGSSFYESKAPRLNQLQSLGLRTYQAVQNRFCAYFRNMTSTEFLLFAPILLFGSGLKARESQQPIWVRWIYAFGMWMMGLAAMTQLILQIDKHQQVRQANLANRDEAGKYAMLKALLR